MSRGMTSYNRSRPTLPRNRPPVSGKATPGVLLVQGLHSLLSGKQFDVTDAILNSLKNLEVTLDIDSQVKIDDCMFSLSMSKHELIRYRFF